MQTLLQPFRTFGDFHITYSQTTVSRTCFRILYLDLYSIPRQIIYFESIYQRFSQIRSISIPNQICSQISRHSIMRCSIDTIRCNIYFEYIITLYVIIILCQRPRNSRLWQYDNTIMAFTDTYFILGTNHSE